MGFLMRHNFSADGTGVRNLQMVLAQVMSEMGDVAATALNLYNGHLMFCWRRFRWNGTVILMVSFTLWL